MSNEWGKREPLPERALTWPEQSSTTPGTSPGIAVSGVEVLL